MNWRTQIVIVLSGVALGSATAWQIQAWRWNAKLADQTTSHARELNILQGTINQIKDETARQLAIHQDQQREQAARLAEIDADHYKELRRAQAENARLRVDIDVGRVRVPVSTVCPASNRTGVGDVLGTAGAAGLDDGAISTELQPAVAGRIVGIGGDAEECARKLSALQQWVKSQRTAPLSDPEAVTHKFPVVGTEKHREY